MARDKAGIDSPIPEQLLELIPEAPAPEQHPEAFVRSVHKAWKERGGMLQGKHRHSDRFLKEFLTRRRSDVRSLTPKLVGKTKIKPDDAEKLLRLFLINWPVPDDASGGSEANAVKYVPLLPEEEVNDVADFIAEQISSSTSVEPAQSLPNLPGESVGDLITRMFEESRAYYIVATERALVQEPRRELVGFRDIINRLKDIEDVDGKLRLIVWIVDLGRQSFEDLDSRLRYLHVQNLLTRFKALQLFEDRGRKERWEWLQSRAVFIVYDPRFDQPVDMRGVKRPDFSAHHISLGAIAPEWAKSANFRTLYGSELERLDQRSFSVFVKEEGWAAPTDEDEDAKAYRRYFGYASFSSEDKPNADKIARGLELPSPGDSYEAAYRGVYAAATHLLNLENASQEPRIDGARATAQLRYLGFRLMNLQDFMKL